MKDTEFIQLLNLYLDHEISAADAARLEAEVQSNPARRRVYQQYCRMQKACKMIAADFETEPAQAGAEKKVIAFNPAVAEAEARRRRVGNFYTVGTFAAVAACIAIIFVGQSRKSDAAAPTAASSTPIAQAAPIAPIANPDAAFVASDTASPRGLVNVGAPRVQQMLLVRDPLLLTGTSQAEALRTAAVNQVNNQLAWIESVQLTPLEQPRTPTDLHFAATLKGEGRALGNRATANSKTGNQPAEEMFMFQFRK